MRIRVRTLELLGANQRIRTVELPALRGPIVDRTGVELARSVRAFAVYADPRHVANPASAAAAIAPILGVEPIAILDKLSRDAAFVYLSRTEGIIRPWARSCCSREASYSC